MIGRLDSSRSRVGLWAALLACCIAVVPAAPAARAMDVVTPSDKPNIVVFYMDDVSPHDGRLWTDPNRTPAIVENFIDQGIHFTNAIGESPLCCPGRASLLSGLHTHNNGVERNAIRLFNPKVHLATALQAAGYSTMWLGKYMNAFQAISDAEWAEQTQGWTHIEAPYRFSSRVRTRNGWVYYPGQHPTKIIADRAVKLLHDTPADVPAFLVLSPFNMHAPNTPMPVSEEEYAKCTGLPPWNPPNFNEQDTSDKPAYVRSRLLLNPPSGWPIVTYCREMFGIDSLVRRVTDELEAEGRLENTLLVFTADNGMAWGAHRLRQEKSTPYATAVPLYMSWPTRWGDEARTIHEYTSNIDLAPTFCELAECVLGPYPTGQAAPDGVSLVPLLDGLVPDLGRDALLETLGMANPTAPAWWAVRSTSLSSLGLWHYVEYETGEKELYNLDPAADPYELQNLAGDPAYEGVQSALATRLDELLEEGRVNKPDASIAAPGPEIFKGYNIFSDVATSESTALASGLRRRRTYVFTVHVENHTKSLDSYLVRATTSGAGSMVFRYSVAGVDVTSSVTGAGYRVTDLAPDATLTISLRVTVTRRAQLGALKQATLAVTSATQPGRVDVVKAVARR